MVVDKQQSRFSAKRLSKIALVIILPILLLLGITWFILRSDHAFVIRKVEETALTYFDINLQVGGYQLEWTTPYPLIRFHLRDLSIATKKDPDKPYIRVNHASSEFNPWDLITGNFRTHPFQLDSAWIHLYTDSLDYVREQQKGRAERLNGLGIDFDQLPSFQVNYLDFHRENDYRKKSLWAKFSQLKLQPELDDSGEWSVHVQSNVFFEGLIFNPAAGGYLMDTPARFDLHFYLADNGRALQWRHSILNVGQNELALSGQHIWADTNRLHLQINTEHIMLNEVRRLLNQKLNNTLQGIQVDRPVRAHLSLDKLMVPGWEDAIHLDFQTENAEVRYQAVSMSSATLEGTYSSDCDQDGIGDPRSSCIHFRQLEGDFFGVLPASLQGSISNMIDPYVEASGSMNVDLPRLNSLLSEKEKATFASGNAFMNFNYKGGLDQLVDNPFDDRDIQVRGNAFFRKVSLATADRTVSSPSLSGYLSFNQDQTLLEDIDLEWMGSNIALTGKISNLPEFFFYEDQTLISNLTLHFDELNLNNFKGKTTSPKKQPKSDPALDGQRLEELTRRLANNLNGQLDLRIDKLSYDTLYVTDLTTRLRLFSPRLEASSDTGMVRIDSLMGNFMGRTPVYAHLQVSGERSPHLAIDLQLPAAVEPINAILPKKMELTGGRANMSLRGKVPLRSLLRMNSLPADFQYRGRILLDQLDLEHTSIPHSFRNISGPIVFNNRKVEINQLQFQYDDSPFTLHGAILDFTPFGKATEKKATIDLQLKGKAFSLGSASSQSNAKGKSTRFSPPEFFRDLGYLYQHATGKLDLAIDELKIKKQKVRPFQMELQLLPDSENARDHQLRIDRFNLGFGTANFFKGSAFVKDPDHPYLEADLNALLDLEQLGQLLPSKYIEMQSGDFSMDLVYQSPLYDTLNAKNYLLNAMIDGHATVQNGEMRYNYRDFNFQNITGRFQFDQQALFIEELDLEVNGNRLVAEGQSNDFFAFFVLPDQRAHIDLDVHSPRFDFGGFTAPKGLSQDTLRVLRKAEKLMASQISGLNTTDTLNAIQETAGYIDQLLDKGSIEMSTDFQEVVYEDFNAKKVDGRISLAPDTVQLHNLHMNVADGSFSIAGLISNVVRHQPKLEVSLQLDENNVREVFRQFDNFGQGDLGYKNLEGEISANIDFRADVNSSYNILPETMHGDMNLTLTGGELLNVKLFEKLSGFLFRNRGMGHVILDTLELQSHIRGSDLYVDKFHLHSSPFDFEAEGRYSLGAENTTRVLFTIPLGNLFNRHISLEEMQEENSERKGLFNILIEARYKKGRMRFIWKPIVLNRKQYRLREGN